MLIFSGVRGTCTLGTDKYVEATKIADSSTSHNIIYSRVLHLPVVHKNRPSNF